MESPSKENRFSDVDLEEDHLLDAEQFLSKDLLDKLDSNSPVRSSNPRPEFYSDGSVFRLGNVRLGIDLSQNTDLFRKNTWQEKESSFSPNDQMLFSKTPQAKHINPFYQQIDDFRLSEEIEDYWTTQGSRIGWVCSGCRNFNYENRRKCNMCKKQKSATIVGEKNKNIKKFIEETDVILPKNAVEDVKKPTLREGNWECVKCKNVNFSFRTICNRCNWEKQ